MIVHYNQIEYFLAIVNSGGFSRAAEAIFISQSSLSKQIKSLEEELGTELFNRKTPGCNLTESGEIFLKYATAVKQQHIELMETLGSGTKNTLNIKLGALPIMSVGAYEFTSVIADFQAEHLNYNVEYIEKDQRSILSLLNNNELDFAIVRTDDPNLAAKYDILPLCMDEFVLVCSRSHRLSGKKLVTLKELANENFLLLEQKSQIYHICITALTKANVSPKVVYSNTRHNMILEMVAKNIGITIMPKNLALSSKFNTKIIKLNDSFYSKVSLIRNKNTKQSKHCLAFWKYIEQRIK